MDYPTAIVVGSAIFTAGGITLKLLSSSNGKVKNAIFETRLDHLETTVKTIDKKVDKIILEMPKRRTDE